MILVASESLLSVWSRIASTHDVVILSQDNLTVALETIRRHRSTMVVLEEPFAVSSEAAAFVARLQTDPDFQGIELRVLTADGAALLRSAKAVANNAAVNLATLTRPMLQRAVRVWPTGLVNVLVDGEPATLVNLSPSGTQVRSALVLRPQQRVRVSFPLTGRAPIRTQGSVVWSTLELAGTPTYRAGIRFITVLPLTVEEVIAQL
jgi:hypothetical protein